MQLKLSRDVKLPEKEYSQLNRVIGSLGSKPSLINARGMSLYGALERVGALTKQIEILRCANLTSLLLGSIYSYWRSLRYGYRKWLGLEESYSSSKQFSTDCSHTSCNFKQSYFYRGITRSYQKANFITYDTFVIPKAFKENKFYIALPNFTLKNYK